MLVVGLTDELSKIRREIEKKTVIAEVLLAKLDGSAKGGFDVAVQERTVIPINLVGQGERIGDQLEPDETMTEFVIDEPIYFRVIDDKRHHRS